tara:strand:- start:351 stop:1574 length:1224 start_codon:yes stop_codon:yes gene_type:complete
MHCRHCNTKLGLTFIDLGKAPPSNNYLTKDELHKIETKLPLKVVVCENCWLVQTEDHTSSTEIFKNNYAYFSAYSKSWLEHSKNYVEMIIKKFNINKNSKVIEVASNDGYLLQYFKEKEIPCIGVEPTLSTAKASLERGIETINEFFGTNLANVLKENGHNADLIIANNVLAHVPDINDFVAGFDILLNKSGFATFEFPHLLKLVTLSQFDTIYHEHFSYLSLNTVNRIFQNNGLKIFDVDEIKTHGGSLRVYAEKIDGNRLIKENVLNILSHEINMGIKTKEFYGHLSNQSEIIKSELKNYLHEMKLSKKTIAAYGAAAKGNTLLNYCEINNDTIEFVVDLNPAKQKKFLPGSHIPIYGEDMLIKKKPDIIIILPWNLKSEIISQLKYTKEWNAKLVTAIPKLDIF